MKKLAVILFVFLSQCAFAQLDSLKLALPMTMLTNRLDSIQASVHSQVDSVTQSYQQVTSQLQGLTSGYQQKIDSLSSLNLPTEKYTQKIDSLGNVLAQTKQKAEAKITSIKQQATEKISSLSLPPALQTKVSQVTSSLNKLDLSSLPSGINSPIDLNGLDVSLDKLTQSNPLNGVDLPSMDGVTDVTGKLGNVSDLTNGVTDQAGNIQQQAGGVMNNVGQVNQVDKLAENQLSQIDAVKGLQEATGNLPVAGMPSEEEAKKQLAEQAQQAVQKMAVDHFAGKQEVLQSAMDKMAKYKEKYESLNSLDDAKKLRNAMKGKPFVERFVPGVALQFQVKEDWWMDTYVSAGYRIAGKITAGTGWNQRVAYNFGSGKFNPQAKIYGIRNYGEFRFKKGFIARGEVEWMNAFIQSPAGVTDAGQREWVFGISTGLKKEYKFLKTVKGNVQIMYNIWDPHDKSPYANRLNVRMGFELTLKKKPKQPTSNGS